MRYNAELVGKIIHKERKKRNWNLENLGSKLGITGKQISKYEKGTPMPPIDMLLKLCDVFDCELGYLLGEEDYSEGTKLQTAALQYLCLTTASADVIKKITGTEKSCLSFGYESDRYIQVLNALLSSSLFPDLIEALAFLEGQLSEYDQVLEELEVKWGKDFLEKVCDRYRDGINEKNVVELCPEVYEATGDLDRAIDKCKNLSYSIKIARYELNETFQRLINNIFPR